MAGEDVLQADRHRGYFRKLAERADRELWALVPAGRARLDDESPNLRAAIDDGCARAPDDAVAMVGALGLYWRVRGRLAEGVAATEQSLRAAPPEPSAGRALALAKLSVPSFWLGDFAHQHERAVRLSAAVHKQRSILGLVAFPPARKRTERHLAAVGTALGEENLKKAFEEGTRLSLEEAIAYAQRGRGEHASATYGWASLSPVERQVVQLASQGLNNPNIARELFMSRNAVKAHLSHAYAKLGVANRTELARLAARHSHDRQQSEAMGPVPASVMCFSSYVRGDGRTFANSWPRERHEPRRTWDARIG